MLRFETRAVLAGAYRGHAGLINRLTHTAKIEPGTSLDPVVLCELVLGKSLADPHATDPETAPTCQSCLKLDPRFHRP